MRPPGSLFRAACRSVLALVLCAWPLAAQNGAPAPSQEVATLLAESRARLAAEAYVTPPAEIERLVAAPRHLNVALTRQSPDRRHFLVEESEGLPPLAKVGRRWYNLAGLQVDPAAHRARTLTVRGAAGLKLVDATTGRSTAIEVPRGATVSAPTWSPDGSQVAFLANFDNGSHVYVAEVATGRSRPVTRTPVLATLVTTVDWTADGRHLVTVLVPEGRGPEPPRPAVATTPQVQLWLDSLKSPQRVHASLLQDPHDQALLEYHTTGQLALIDVRSRHVRKIGAPAMIKSVDISPDGRYLRVTTMRKPFSYVVPWTNFGDVEELWDLDGKVLAEIAKRPLREAQDTAADGAPPRPDGGRRGLAWMPRGEGLYYLTAPPPARASDSAATPPATPAGPAAARAAQGGAARADRVIQWKPPFGPGDTVVLYRGDGPIADILFTDDARMLFVGTNRNGTGEIYAVRLDAPDTRYTIVRQRAYTPAFVGRGGGAGGGGGGAGARAGADDSLAFYHNPGALMTTRGTHGGLVALVSSDSAVFLSGTRYFRNQFQQAPRAFVDKVRITSGETTRIFEGPTDAWETIVAPLDHDFTQVVVTRQSPTEVPNALLRDLATGATTRLTDNRDYTPEFTALQRHRIWVTRADGIRFLVRLTLPADYRPGTRLPGMLWLYPYEYTDQAGYERSLRTENINTFPSSGPRTIEFLALRGYAVANFNPPIIGEQGRMNDNYVPDLRMNLVAVIDELDRQGFIDRTRLGIGGHSYGAFSTANAMVHTPFFRAGIAGDGMYNRTLTPNGFQSERRDLWAAQRTYLEMSPMLYAERMQGALLMYHGQEDQNVGTAPISSVRMMHALRAHGKVAALYMYPYEDHGPVARETLLDLWARWTAWLDIYVKHHGVTVPKATTVAGREEPNR